MIRSMKILAFIGVLFLLSCEKETQPAEENDNELITTIQLDFTKRNSDDKATFIWEDADGAGGDVPYTDTIKLDDNSVYDVKISFWNKSVTPADDITQEITTESENHRVYVEPTAASNIVVSNYDIDVNGMPLGTNNVWSTGDSAEGNVAIVLRHYPEGGKAADDPVNSTKSSTDAGAVFIVTTGN